MKCQLTRTFATFIILLLLSSFETNGQWKQVNGPFQGDAQKIVFKGSDMYAMVFKAGIYKSTDEGNSWSPVNTGLNAVDIQDITANNKNIYIANYDGVFILSGNETIWKKTTLPTKTCHKLCCSGDTIYAGDYEGGIYTSKDGGSTWGPRVIVQSGPFFSSTAGKDIVFVSKDQREINYSDDCGVTWSQINMGSINTFSDVTYKNSRLYLANDYGVFVTKNKGLEWEWIKGIDNVRKISVDKNNIAVLAEKLYLSADTGKTWKIIDLSSIYNTSVTTFNGKTYLLNYRDGIFKSADQGLSWEESNFGMLGAYVKSFVKYKDELVVCANGKVYSSADFGTSWKFTGLYANWITSYDTVLLASSKTLDFIAKKKDNSWTIVKSRLNSVHGLYKSYVNGSTIYAGESFYLLKSDNAGEKWDTIFNYLKVPDRVGNSFGLEDVLTEGDNIFIAGGDGGLFRSTDKGVSWKQIRTETCNSLKKFGNKILLGSNSGIFSSSNNGDTWITHKLIFGVKDIAIFRGSIIMTSYNAIHTSFDGGNKWRNFGDIPGTPICLSIFTMDTTVFCGTYYQGIYKRPFKDVLTFKADDKSKAYGSPNPSFTFSVSGFTNGDDVSSLALLPTGHSAVEATSPTGVYPITLKGGKDSAYHYTFVDGSMTINKAPLKVQVNNKTKRFGDPNPPFDCEYLGFVNGENESVVDVKPTITCQADERSNSGSYPIIASGASDNNYEISYTNGTLTITSLTSIPEVEDISGYQIYPNPASTFVSLKTDFEKAKIVRIYRSDGKLMIEKVLSGEKLEISALPPGVYYLKIDGKSIKFIKN